MTITTSHASNSHTRTQQSEYVQTGTCQVCKMEQSIIEISQSEIIPEFNKSMIVKSIENMRYDIQTAQTDETFANEEARNIEINEIVENYNNQISMITTKWGELN